MLTNIHSIFCGLSLQPNSVARMSLSGLYTGVGAIKAGLRLSEITLEAPRSGSSAVILPASCPIGYAIAGLGQVEITATGDQRHTFMAASMRWSMLDEYDSKFNKTYNGKRHSQPDGLPLAPPLKPKRRAEQEGGRTTS